MERNIPRWDNPEDYKYTDSHDVRDWGWEFIRRNPVYIKNWEKRLKGFQDKEVRESFLYTFCFFILPKLFPEQAGLEENGSIFNNSKELKRRIALCEKHGINLTNPKGYETFEIIDGLWYEWGLHTCQNPAARRLTMCNKAASLNSFYYITSAYDKTEKTKPLEKGWCEARINLALPLLSQIEHIKHLAEIEQKNYKRYIKPEHAVIDSSRRTNPKNKNLWKNYIRCLDASKAGAKRKEASKILFTANANTQAPEKMWDETMKQANNMVVSSYRTLMF